jgi:hypothetical protein
MNREPDWMPVFTIIERSRSMHAAHPDHKESLPQDYIEDVVQRIGTARREENGSYIIQLTSLPLNGQLLMRPPRSGECPESTTKERL